MFEQAPRADVCCLFLSLLLYDSYLVYRPFRPALSLANVNGYVSIGFSGKVCPESAALQVDGNDCNCSRVDVDCAGKCIYKHLCDLINRFNSQNK